MSALLPDPAFALAVVAKATLLLLAAAVATLALSRRRAPAAARHLVWTLAVCGLLALPFFSITLPGWRLGFVRLGAERWNPAAPASSTPAPSPAIAESPRSTAGDADVVASPSPETAVTEGVGGGGIDWEMVLPALYLLGVLAVAARVLAGRWSVRRLAREASPVTTEEWTSLLRDLAWMMDVDRPVTLLRGARATMPMTWGTRRPTILLPGDADEWPEDRRRVVLLHELAHVARRDCLTQTLAAAACALYWFHPGAWHAARRLRVERELACDDRVLAAGTRAREYAAHLLEVARAFRPSPLAGAVAVSMARPSQLEGRLLAVLDHLRNRHVLTRRAGLGAAAAALALVLPLSAARPAGESASPPVHRAPSADRPATTRTRPPTSAAPQSGCVVRDGDGFNCEIRVRPGERLRLELAKGAGARVEAWERDEVRVTSESGRRLDATADRAAGGVRVSVTAARGHAQNDGPDLVIQVPRRFDVDASADGGGVEIRAVHGTFTGTTRGGGLALIEAEGTLRMDAGGGGAYIRHTRLDGRLEMGGGGVLLDENRGNLDIVGGGAIVRGSAGELSQWGQRVRDETDDAEKDPDADAVTVIPRATGHARDGDGDVDVESARPGARIETDGGDIRVRRARGDITATTGGGDVTLESVAGGATVSTGGGDVEVRLDGGGDVDITSGSGRVTLVVPAGFSGSVELESAYTQRHAPTHVTSDFPLAISQTRDWSGREGTARRYVRGRATLGGGRHHVRVRTVNGDVRLVRAGGRGVNVTAQVGGDAVQCTGESCTLTLASDKGSGRATVSWASGPGGRPVISADAVGYGYTTGDVQERLEAMDAITRNAPPAAAAQALGRFAFGDPEPRVQRAAVEGLAALRGRAGAEQLRRIAREHPSASIRRRAADALR